MKITMEFDYNPDEAVDITIRKKRVIHTGGKK